MWNSQEPPLVFLPFQLLSEVCIYTYMYTIILINFSYILGFFFFFDLLTRIFEMANFPYSHWSTR